MSATIKAKLQDAVKAAMKEKNQVKLNTLRGTLAAMQYEAIEKKVDDLADEQALTVIQREIKKRKEEIDFANQADRKDLLANLNTEIATLEAFLPQQLSALEIEKFLTDLKTSTPGINMGLGMKALKDKYAGQYDGKTASEVAKRVLG